VRGSCRRMLTSRACCWCGWSKNRARLHRSDLAGLSARTRGGVQIVHRRRRNLVVPERHFRSIRRRSHARLADPLRRRAPDLHQIPAPALRLKPEMPHCHPDVPVVGHCE
jgi:hypothetical protein